MQIDATSFNDISIFNTEEEYSIFHKLNFTRTAGGKEWLRRFFSSPFNDIHKITATQDILKKLSAEVDEWPEDISNGTMLVMYKFFDYDIDDIGVNNSNFGAYLYRVLHSADYSMIRFSVSHFADFFRGLQKISQMLSGLHLHGSFKIYTDRMEQLLRLKFFEALAGTKKNVPLTVRENVFFAGNIRGEFRSPVMELMEIFYRIDAWYSMAVAVKKFNLVFPKFIDNEKPVIHAEGLYHLLIQKPVPYDLVMSPKHHFLFLTGANMAGKSTLIKSVGAAVFLAHIGMGVPAANMELTLFDGLISNINVVDNIAKGESFFFNEVQRIKNTVTKVSDGKKWLVLIDELFKGTNIQDAMKCSLAVINGLVKVETSLFILSTHLYEIGAAIKQHGTISFRYFETTVTDDALSFSYQLKEGISDDRLGYVILKREKVVEMLDRL